MRIMTLATILLMAGWASAGQITQTTAEMQVILDTALTTSGSNSVLVNSAEDIDHVVTDELAQFGAGGYSAATNVAVLNGQWTDVPASFIIPFVSGFEYVSGSTVRYIGHTDHAFLFGGSTSLVAGQAGQLIEVGLETNGVYLVGSTSGQRKFSTTTDAGSMSYAIPITLSSNDTIGLIIKATSDQTIDINTWQSWAVRF